jgi:hypothetical protein
MPPGWSTASAEPQLRKEAPETVRCPTVADVESILRSSLERPGRKGVVVRLFTRAREQCEHVPDQAVGPRADACQDCGSRFNLRVCTECGYVGCCESQLGHDRDHAMQTGHAVIRSLPLSEHSFTWCYACHRYV